MLIQALLLPHEYSDCIHQGMSYSYLMNTLIASTRGMYVLLLPHEYSDCIHQGDMQHKRVGKAHKDSGYIDRHDYRIVY